MASTTSLNKLAINGAFWSVFGYGLTNIIRFGANLILTRLLEPELFGLMALATTFLVGLNLFSDVGITPSIIQSKRGEEPTFYNTAWTIQAIRGFCLWLACCLIAYPASQFYEEPRLMWLIPILGITTIVQGLTSTSIPILKRNIQIQKTVLLELGCQLTALTVTICWALYSQSIWALVFGNLISVLARCFISYYLVPKHKNKFHWDPQAAKEMFRFGRWIFISTALTFLAMQGDRLVVGKIVSIEMLGIYSLCIALADIPRQVVERLGSGVIFPGISRSVSLPREELRQKFLKKRWLVLVGSMLLATFLVSTGDILVEFLYDERYARGAWILSVLALGFWHTVLYDTVNPCLLGLGKPFYGTIGYALRFSVLMFIVPLVHSMGGFVVAVFVIAFHDVPMYLVITSAAARERISTFQQDIVATLLFFLILTIALYIRYALGYGLPLVNAITNL